MPIQAPGRPILAQQIRQTLIQARNAGLESSANSDEIINQLSLELTDAIHQYVTTIIVTVKTSGSITGTSPSGPVTGIAETTGTS
jgi:hypothetical protein